MCTQNPFPRIQTDDPPGIYRDDPVAVSTSHIATLDDVLRAEGVAAACALDLEAIVLADTNARPEDCTRDYLRWLTNPENLRAVAERIDAARNPVAYVVASHRERELERRIVELEAAIRTLHMRASCWMAHDRVEIRAAGRSVRGVTAEVLSNA